MSLPIVLEIAIGLIFIYLTLSLVASEIQEILSALFQWRAEHLKRSIEQLLAGERRSRTNDFVDSLYASPLIADLNYEAQGRLAGAFRSLAHLAGALYRTLTFSRNVFGNQTSGPSYIPAEAFATSLIERLKLADFQWLLGRSRFSEFVTTEISLPLHNMVSELRARCQHEDLLLAEMAYFDQSLTQVLVDLSARRLTIETALNQVASRLQAFEMQAAETMAEAAAAREVGSDQAPNVAIPLAGDAIARSFISRVGYLRSALGTGSSSGSDPTFFHQTTALIARIQPSLGDLAALLDPDSPTYAELVALVQREGGAIWQAFEALQPEAIPPSLRASLATLSQKAEARIRATGKTTETELQQLQIEVETWFNNGMERASGVYRRNVKGVGLMIGLAIAFTVNADTFYMFQRLSTDSAIRSSIVQTAERVEIQGITTPQQLSEDLSINDISGRVGGDLRSIGSAVEDVLAEYPLPIGRTKSVIAAQKAAEAGWPVPFIPLRFLGWMITAIALSMGASFWFDLLRKVMSVRSSGDRPK